MEEQIKKIIENDLPKQVGDVLKTRLEQADKDAEMVIQLKKDKKVLADQIQIQADSLGKYAACDVRNENLDRREKEITDKERNIEIEKLKYQMQCEKDKTAHANSIAMGLVRNIEYRRSLNDAVTEQFIDANGMTHYPNKSQISNETNSAE